MSEPIIITIKKPKRKAKVGLRFRQTDNGNLLVSFISPGGICEKSDLEVNDEIQSVNGVTCKGKTPEEIVEFIRKTKGEIHFCIANREDLDTTKDESDDESERDLTDEIFIQIGDDEINPSFECLLDTSLVGGQAAF